MNIVGSVRFSGTRITDGEIINVMSEGAEGNVIDSRSVSIPGTCN